MTVFPVTQICSAGTFSASRFSRDFWVGGEVKARQAPDHGAIGLLREGRLQVAGAQTRFHMAYRDVPIEGRQGPGQAGCGVALHQHHVRLFRIQNTAQRFEGPRRHPEEVLVLAHDVQIVVGLDLEEVQDLVEHLAMLRGHADPALNAVGLFQCRDQRCHLDGFRSRAEDGQDL